MDHRAVGSALLVSLVACSPRPLAPPVAPEPAACVDTTTSTPPAEAPVVAVASAPAPECPEPEPEHQLIDEITHSEEAPHVLHEEGLTITLRPDEDEGPGGDVRLVARLLIEEDGRSKVRELTQMTEIDQCSEATPRLDVIWSNEETMVIDAQLVCSTGFKVHRQQVAHTVVAVTTSPVLDDFGQARVLHVGHSEVIDHGGMSIKASRMMYYVEARKLAAYRQTVAWCDRKAMMEALGYVACEQDPRKLTEVARVPLFGRRG